MDNIEQTKEEMDEIIINFAKTNSDDFEYISALGSGKYGWLKLSSGKTVYVSPPQSNAEEVGNAFKKLYDNMQCEDSKISKIIKQVDVSLIDEKSQQTKNIHNILNELSEKWNKLI